MKNLLLLSLFFIITSCIPPSAEMIQTAIVETQTQEIIAQKTQQAEAYATVAMQNTHISQTTTAAVTDTPLYTPTPRNTATPRNTPLPLRLRTATAVKATQLYAASFASIAWKELKGYPDNHKGQKIQIKGKVFQIIQAIDMLLFYPGTYDLFYVTFNTTYSGIYEGEIITIYGRVLGTHCYDTMAGGTNCVPLIEGYMYQ